MVNADKAKEVISGKIEGVMTIVKTKDYPDAHVFYCKNNINGAIPGGMIYAVSKSTGNIGASIVSEDDAIKNARR